MMSPQGLRAQQDAQNWAVEGCGLRGVELSVVEQACAAAADRLGRELDVAEVDVVCAWTVAAADAASEAAIAGAREAP
jgi:hypothetical protein